jgi:threonine dehydratase
MTIEPFLPPDAAELERAAQRVYQVCLRTPLVRARTRQGNDTTAPIWLKPETLQPIGSFKLRGVYNAVAAASAEQRARGLLTVSAGNTAQALAWCGRHFGVPATSLMPEGAPRSKIDAVIALGGQPRLVPREELFAFLQEQGWLDESSFFVHPWIEPRVIAGHASLGLEIADSLASEVAGQTGQETTEVYVSVGGGGLISGVGVALRARQLGRSTRLIAVEPAGCPALSEAMRLGRPVEVQCKTFCDGVAVPYITDTLFPLLRELVSAVVLVEEQSTRDALADLAYGNRLIVEGSAALTYAAARASSTDLRKICVLSGGSVDDSTLLSILDDAAIKAPG